VFSQSLQRASEIGLEARLLPLWYDVDDAESLRLLCTELFSAKSGAPDKIIRGYPAPHTRQYLHRLLKGGAGPRLGFRLPTAGQGI
jgi:hypothetical protein